MLKHTNNTDLCVPHRRLLIHGYDSQFIVCSVLALFNDTTAHILEKQINSTKRIVLRTKAITVLYIINLFDTNMMNQYQNQLTHFNWETLYKEVWKIFNKYFFNTV